MLSCMSFRVYCMHAGAFEGAIFTQYASLIRHEVYIGTPNVRMCWECVFYRKKFGIGPRPQNLYPILSYPILPKLREPATNP